MKDERLYLRHILEAIRKIEQYTAQGRPAFASSPMAQDAVIRNFEIIGEAAKRLSAASRDRAPEVPWKAVCGFRDVLIHDYDAIDLETVWAVVENELPVLKAAATRLLGA